ncbi:MAG: NAD(P)/FAD-dependent oxidoreductase [Phycisphaeraceae bacterium]
MAGTSTRSIEPGSCEIKREIKHGSLRGYGVLLDARGHGLPGGQVVMRCGSAGYVGTAVLEDGRLDIAAALDPAAVKAAGGPAGAAARVALEAGHPLDDLRALRWRATAPLTGRRRRLALPGVMFLGDAAGYVEPFTGEGMAWALRSAQAAVPIALDAVSNGWTPSHEQRWERAHRDAVRRRQWRCRVFSAVLRRPMLTNAAVAALRCVPARVMPTAMRLALPPVFADAPPAQPMGHRPCV